MKSTRAQRELRVWRGVDAWLETSRVGRGAAQWVELRGGGGGYTCQMVQLMDHYGDLE
jgi:hypothetical protein